MTDPHEIKYLSPERVRFGARIAAWIMGAFALVPIAFAIVDPGSIRLFWVSLAITLFAIGLIVRLMGTQQPDTGRLGTFRDDPRTRRVLLLGSLPALFASLASIALAVPSLLAAARGDGFVVGIFPDIDSHLVVGVCGPLLAVGITWLMVWYLYSRRGSWDVDERSAEGTTII